MQISVAIGGSGFRSVTVCSVYSRYDGCYPYCWCDRFNSSWVETVLVVLPFFEKGEVDTGCGCGLWGRRWCCWLSSDILRYVNVVDGWEGNSTDVLGGFHQPLQGRFHQPLQGLAISSREAALPDDDAAT